jgi:beta-fructofuranosidase
MMNFASLYVSMLLGLLAFVLPNGRKIASFGFAKEDRWVVREVVSGDAFGIQSKRKNAEFVTGINGEAVRLDGYSTFVKGAFPKQLPTEFSVSGWFALESFPTDTAGFFSFGDASGKNWVAASVDRFGKPLLASSQNGIIKYVAAGAVIEKFKWLNVVMTVKRDRIALWLNGTEVLSMSSDHAHVSLDQFFLGRDHREKLIYNYYPVPCINGLMDEVNLWNGILDQRDITALSREFDATQQPDLAIPSVRFKDDFNRPAFHLLPAANWTNESHGLIFYKGRYHIFNQKNASGVYLQQINWGHFSSPDLISWTEHKPALTPEFDYEQLGIWSGHAVLDDSKKPLIMYTGSDGSETSLSIAFPADDSLIRWNKFDGNPVARKPSGYTRNDMRDPYIWKEGSDWYMIVGQGHEESGVKKGTVLMYKSADLREWKYIKPLFSGDPVNDDTGIFWEMPVFWKLNGKRILLINKVPQPGKPAVAFYWTGDFKNETFIPDHKIPKRLEVVNRLLSPSVALDEKGRTVAIAIIPDETSALHEVNLGWAHLFSVPRVWDLRNGKIIQSPHPSLVKLRAAHTSIPPGTVNATTPLLSGAHQAEIVLELEAGKSTSFSLVLGKNAENTESTLVTFDFDRDKIIIDLRQSTLDKSFTPDLREVSYKLEHGKKMKLHFFVDGSVAEFFIDDEDAFTTRFFPTKNTTNTIELKKERGELRIHKGDTWTLNRANNNTDW